MCLFRCVPFLFSYMRVSRRDAEKRRDLVPELMRKDYKTTRPQDNKFFSQELFFEH